MGRQVFSCGYTHREGEVRIHLDKRILMVHCQFVHKIVLMILVVDSTVVVDLTVMLILAIA